MKPAHQIIDTVLLTEKGTILTEKQNQYTFRVYPSANKNDIKVAVESLFKVNVASVRTMNCIGKKKRERSPNYGRTSAWKKAVVTLKNGETIDLT